MKEVDIEDNACQVKNNIIYVPMLAHIFDHAEEGDSKAQPCDRKAKHHNEGDIDDLDKGAEIVPLKAEALLNTEKLFHSS
jgi:hypothetical protein